MKYRKLGNSNLEVSVIGVGTMSWPYSAFAEKKPENAIVDRAGVLAIVEKALDLGINLFDTAEGYGRGFSEKLLGEALNTLQKRSEVIVCTKVGRAGEAVGESCDLSQANIFRRCELSLRRLQTDYLDLYLAHRPDPRTPVEETVAAFETLRQQGKIRYFGISGFDPSQMADILRHGIPVANQLPYSLVERGIDQEIREYCVRHNIGIMVYSPLAKGLLSGKYTAQSLPPPVDDRRQHHFKPETLESFFAIAAGVQKLADELEVKPSVLALSWCLSKPGITTVLPGAKSSAQLSESASAADFEIPASVLQRLNAISNDLI